MSTTKQIITCPRPQDEPENTPHMGDKRYQFWASYISVLEGKLLTLMEMAITDKEQLKATKDVIRNTIWEWAETNSWCRRCHNRKLLECSPKCPEAEHTHYCPDCNCYEYGPYVGAGPARRNRSI